MIKSLKAKLFLIYTGVMILILFSAWFCITYFSQTYYGYKKAESMKEFDHQIEEIIAQKENKNLSYNDFAELSFSYESGFLISVDNDYIYSDKNGFILTRILSYMTFEDGVTRLNMDDFLDIIRPSSQDLNGKGRLSNHDKMPREILVYNHTDTYGNRITLYMPLQSIQDSIDIIQQLLYIITLIALVLISVLTYMISRSIINPIIEVNNVAVEMSQLDFTKKCNSKRKDEIGELSNSINTLSDKLEVTINQLKTELKKEKSTDQLRKQFIGQVSHELQTPLSIINSYIEALMDGVINSPDEIKSSYMILLDETAKMSKIIRDLLDLSQLESGVFKVEFTNIDLGDLLDGLYSKYYEILKSMDVSFEKSGIESGYVIQGDPFRIEQAISNLVQNAIKYTPSGGQITLIMTIRNDYIQVMVENTGSHIDEKDIDVIWESFYKNKQSKKEGIGLGLAITKQIITLHGGDYFVRNTEQGVLFGIHLKYIKD